MVVGEVRDVGFSSDHFPVVGAFECVLATRATPRNE
jgi:hypothetical protein